MTEPRNAGTISIQEILSLSRYILGLHAGHNASACIGDESGLLYAIQEERLSRREELLGLSPSWRFRPAWIASAIKPGRFAGHDLRRQPGDLPLSQPRRRDHAFRRQATVVGRFRQRVAVPLVAAVAPELRPVAICAASWPRTASATRPFPITTTI